MLIKLKFMSFIPKLNNSLSPNSEDIVTSNMIESMFRLQPLHYEHGDESIVYEKIQFLSSCGRRTGEIIEKFFEPE